MVELKKIVFAIIVLVLFSSLPQVFAQISIGEPAKQTVEITLKTQGEVHVVHEVERSNTVSQVDLIADTFSDLKVVDIEGNEVQHAMVSGTNVGITR